MAASSSSGKELSPPPEARRFLPGPWTHEETANLIDAYMEKWRLLKKRQLKASHWEEVAEDVRLRCGLSNLSKTSTQCRHKMEKLRQRYKAERQKGFPGGSSWVFFDKMDLMENGPLTVFKTTNEGSDTTENGANNTRSLHLLMSNGRFRPPADAWAGPAVRRKDEDISVEADADEGVLRSLSSSRSGVKQGNPIGELTAAIKCLGDGFMKLEHRKMEMMREVERMRMEMEMNRTKMIIESQQQIADVFADAVYARKKLKRMSSPDS
ncbi:trihelix transcription factor ENAP2-like [Nymphaea colorata]|uniref:Myb-like domain-containing protein n=1 Tax=Nymphaea colorata TaxID=210225 RepID=A0A5K0YVV4_9MAGN|nr:trihelix transcription factor ENAP2-like [Nymphaea colorata]VVV82351.1 unnamed protein product [Nymphaea colorata]